MTSIFTRTANALATLAPAIPYALAPYQTTGAALPDVFIAYQLITSPAEEHADDAETQRLYRVQVTIWSRAGLAVLPNVDTAMVTAGFMKSDERQLPRDPTSLHFGLAKDYTYLEGV